MATTINRQMANYRAQYLNLKTVNADTIDGKMDGMTYGNIDNNRLKSTLSNMTKLYAPSYVPFHNVKTVNADTIDGTMDGMTYGKIDNNRLKSTFSNRTKLYAPSYVPFLNVHGIKFLDDSVHSVFL